MTKLGFMLVVAFVFFALLGAGLAGYQDGNNRTLLIVEGKAIVEFKTPKDCREAAKAVAASHPNFPFKTYGVVCIAARSGERTEK